MNFKTIALTLCLFIFAGFVSCVFAQGFIPAGTVTNFNGVLRIRSTGASFSGSGGLDFNLNSLKDNTPLRGMLYALGQGSGGVITPEQLDDIANAIIKAAFDSGYFGEGSVMDKNKFVSSLYGYIFDKLGYTPEQQTAFKIAYNNTEPKAIVDQAYLLKGVANTAATLSGSQQPFASGGVESGEKWLDDFNSRVPSTLKKSATGVNQIAEKLLTEASKNGYEYDKANGQLLLNGDPNNKANEYLQSLGPAAKLSPERLQTLQDQGVLDCYLGDGGITSGAGTGATQGSTGNDSGSTGSTEVKKVTPKVKNETEATQNSKTAVIKVSTNTESRCEYKKGSSFTYGSGTDFDTTESYNHNTEIKDIANGSYTYYVACKDVETGGTSTAIKITFKVDQSTNQEYAPKITNTTASPQTTVSSTLSVKTEKDATCQYKIDSDFNYGETTKNGATQFAVDGTTLHSATISTPNSKEYLFFVVCKDKATGAANVPGIQVKFTVDVNNQSTIPQISNTTSVTQTTNTPALSVSTNINAMCQYKESSDFAYGTGTQFTIDGAIDHRTTLPSLAAGSHTFFVVCKNPTTGAVNVPGAQVVFTIDTGSGTCAALTSNDRQNDNDRSNSGSSSSSSVFLWQAVETGTRESFKKVNWYAGYQFTPQKNGQVTQLCGYFESGITNKVSLYSGSYTELASAQISGSDGWRCASISPVTVNTDSRYYVIARVQSNPIYYEYKSGMLPKDANNSVVEAGIRQSAEGSFGNNIKKYDYIIFGLVDAKIRYGTSGNSGPQITYSGPSGTISANSAALKAITGVDATCKFDREDIDYNSMAYALPKAATNNFEQLVCGLAKGSFTFYVRCKSTAGGQENNSSTAIQFTISQ